MNYNSRSISGIIKLLSAVAVSGFFLFGFGLTVLAQGLTLEPSSPATLGAGQDFTGVALVATRFVLAAILGTAGAIGVYTGYRWFTAEGNALKSYENKHTFARTILVITVVFIIMAMMRIYIPDYSTLTF